MTQTLRKFLRCRNGNFATLTAVLAVPVIGAMGVAIDISTLALQATGLQDAVDSSALTLAYAKQTTSDAEAEQLVKNMLKANFPDIDLKVTATRNFPQVKVVARAELPTTFMHIFGQTTMSFTRQAVVDVAEAKYEIALVLDTTGSMEGGKLTALKTAATTLINDLSQQTEKPQNLKFALVPFSGFVNVGPGFGPQIKDGKVVREAASWLDTLGASPIHQSDLGANVSRFALYAHLGHEWKGCVETRPVVGGVNHGVLDTAPDPKKPETLFVPTFASDEPPRQYVPLAQHGNDYLDDGAAGLTQQTWNERRARYGVTGAATHATLAEWAQAVTGWTKPTQNNTPTTLYSNYFAPKGPNFLCESQPITPLTSDYAKVKTAISDLVAVGNTNILEGVAWGWRVLSPTPPFTEGAAASTGVNKIMVVLSDGTNFFGSLPAMANSSYSSFGYLIDGRLNGITSGAEETLTQPMNTMTLSTCTNAKMDGLEIYTILLEEPNVTTSALLRDCATTPEHFIAVPDRNGLQAAFNKIRHGILKMRLTH